MPLLLVCCARPCPSWCGSRVLCVCVAPPPVWWRSWVPMLRTPSCPTRLPPVRGFHISVRRGLSRARLAGRGPVATPVAGTSRHAGRSPRPCGVCGHLVEGSPPPFIFLGTLCRRSPGLSLFHCSVSGGGMKIRTKSPPITPIKPRFQPGYPWFLAWGWAGAGLRRACGVG